MRVGVIGHRGYAGLPGVLGALLELAPTIGVTLAFEDELYEIAEDGEPLQAPDGSTCCSPSAVTARCCAVPDSSGRATSPSSA
jgi:hypothetical protein